MTGSPSEGIDRGSNNPFPGLRPFRPAETRLFFGRDEPTGELIGRLGRSRFLAVVGVSGSGKSSLVRCGVLPALHGGFLVDAGSRWRIAMFRPGNDPIGELARALATDLFDDGASPGEGLPRDRLIETVLRRGALGVADVVRQARLEPGERVLIVADQFEELFRFEPRLDGEGAEDDRAAFVKLLLEIARADLPAYVLLTMRSDFLGECAQFRDLPEAISDALYLIPRLTREQLRETIVGPVAVAGGTIAPRLVNQLLNAVGDDPAQLPILQHALMRTWNAWATSAEDGAVDLPHYRAAGGLDGALDQHLGSILAELSDDQREVATRLFRHLVEVTAEGKKIRREATVDQLCAVTGASISEVRAVIEAFRREGRTFLMPPIGRSLDPDTPVDLSHESLIHRWKDLREWIEEEADSIRVYRLLSDAAEDWKTAGRSPYQDPELQRALDWLEQWGDEAATRAWARPLDVRSGRPDGFGRAKEFLRWSERQRARRFRRRVGTVAAGFAAVLGWALVSTADSRFEARAQLAEFAGTRTDPLEGALILNELRTEESLLWRMIGRAWPPLSRKRDRIEARGVEIALGLLDQAIPGVAPPTHPSAVLAVEFDDSGRRLLVRFEDDSAELLDAETGESLDLPAAIETAQGRIKNLFFSDPSTFALYDEDGRLRTANGRTVDTRPGRTDAFFSPDGSRFLALYATPGLVCVWRVGSPDQPVDGGASAPVDGARTPTGGATDGTECGATSDANPVRESANQADLATTPPLALRHRSVMSARFSLDGGWLATRSISGELRVWEMDAAGGVDGPYARLDPEGRYGAVRGMAISRSSGRPLLATAHGDTAQVWEVRRGSLVPCVALPHQDTITSIAFDRVGSRVLTASEDGTARIWDVRAATCSRADSLPRPAGMRVLTGHDGRVDRAEFGPDEARVLTRSSADSTVRLWDVETSRRPRTVLVMRGQVPRAVALSSDRSLVATGGERGGVRIYRSGGTRWFTEPEGAEDIWYVSVGPSGSRFATSSAESVRFWDRAGRPVREPDTLRWEAAHLKFLPDGRLIASGNRTTQVWSPSGIRERELTHRADVHAVGIETSGSHFLVGLGNGWVELWDAARGSLTDSIDSGDGLAIAAVARSPQGFTATGNSLGRLRVWTPDGEPTSLDEKFPKIHSLAFSPDGLSLAAVTGDTVHVRSLSDPSRAWGAGNAGEWREWKVPGAAGIRFLSDTTLVTADSLGTVRVWHASRQDPLRGFAAGSPRVEELSVSANGSAIATWHEDGSVRIWPQSWRGLLRNLRERATRACLSADQRVTRLGEGREEAIRGESHCRDGYWTNGTEDR